MIDKVLELLEQYDKDIERRTKLYENHKIFTGMLPLGDAFKEYKTLQASLMISLEVEIQMMCVFRDKLKAIVDSSYSEEQLLSMFEHRRFPAKRVGE